MITLYLAVPCYNEEAILMDSAGKLLDKYERLMASEKISKDSRICFIDDGSTDSTWSMIKQLHFHSAVFQGIKLSRNRGHQNALLCGLLTLKDRCDAVISLDADLQDDIEAIDEMIERFENGCDIVYGVRKKRDSDSFFKRFTAESYYRILDKMGAKVVFNHADYRLMSRRALDALQEYRETNIFLRGMVPQIGFKSDIVTYDRSERTAGESKYTMSKMLSLAWEGITSFSVKPIKIVTACGIICFAVSIIMLIYFLIRLIAGQTVQGWASLAVSIWALGGLQLLAIGIVGEYIGKIYLEVKNRPRYFIEEYIGDE